MTEPVRAVAQILVLDAMHLSHFGVDDWDWLSVAQLDTFEELRTFVTWAERIGSGERDQGEASVFAVA